MDPVLTFSLCLSIGCRHHETAVLGVRRQCAVVTGEIRPRSGYESGQFSQKLHRLEDKVGGAVSEGMLPRDRVGGPITVEIQFDAI